MLSLEGLKGLAARVCNTYIHTLVHLNLGEVSPAVLVMHCLP